VKFWQLVSIVSNEEDLIFRVASTSSMWKRYEELARNFSTFVKVQDRAMLDTIVDPNFVVAVLCRLRKNLYMSSDNWLRSWKLDTTDKSISILDSFNLYGADIVEAVCERGAAEIKQN
jgi:hypothetical protein